MKVITHKTLVFLLLSLSALTIGAVGQCPSVENDPSRLFISYEKTAKVEIDGGLKKKDGVILRLHNYTGCDLEIIATNAEKFYKAPPPNATLMQRVNPDIEYDLPDGVLVPEMRYTYETSHKRDVNFGGDVKFIFSLRSGRTILFEAPLEHFDLEPESKISVKLRPVFEKENGKTSYGEYIFVEFSGDSLPSEIQEKIKRQKITKK